MNFLLVCIYIQIVIALVISDTQDSSEEKLCESYKCHPHTECYLMKDEKSGKNVPVCIKVPSCLNQKCDNGEKCAMRAVKCQLTPCFKVPTCLPDVNEASPEYQMPPALLV